MPAEGDHARHARLWHAGSPRLQSAAADFVTFFTAGARRTGRLAAAATLDCMTTRGKSRVWVHRLTSGVGIVALVVGGLFAGVSAARARAADDLPADAAAFAARARRAGLRVLAGEHLVLATDRPERAGDGVADLPAVFDQAFLVWCRHYGLDPVDHRGWRACGCLVVDRDRFRAAGLLPDDIPDFVAGHCHRDRFWLADPSNPAYRRHLLLHEGVHAFTLTLRGLAAPTWYTEGIAEFLATHRLEPATDGPPRLEHTPIPAQSGDVEQLGRIERIRALARTGRAPALGQVFAAAPADHRDLSAYAASWAAVTLLARHPATAAAFAAAERGPLDADFTRRLEAEPGWDAARAARDFDAFLAEIDYGYDPVRMEIDWSPGRPLAGPREIRVASDRGWQNTGIALEEGAACGFRAAGRCTIGRLPAPNDTLLETEAGGISLEWYRGRPVGRLMLAQWVEKPAGGGRPAFVVVAEGAAGAFTAIATGPLHAKLNESPGALSDNESHLTATITPAP
jgi:hypothetical protein